MGTDWPIALYKIGSRKEVINGGDFYASNLVDQPACNVCAEVGNHQRDQNQLAFTVCWCRAYDASPGFFLVS